MSQKLISLGTDPAQNIIPLLLKYKGVTANLLMNFKQGKGKDLSVIIGYSNFFNKNIISEKTIGYSNLSQRNQGGYLSIGTKSSKNWGYLVTFSVYSQIDDLLYYDYDFDQSDINSLKTEPLIAVGGTLYKDWPIKISKNLQFIPRATFSYFIGQNSDYSRTKSYIPGAGLLIKNSPVGLGFSCPIVYSISKK